MPMLQGSTRLKQLRWGATSIAKVYWGSTLVFVPVFRPDAVPVPAVVSTADYWFTGSSALNENLETPGEGEGVAVWENLGTYAEDAIQTTAGQRPTYRDNAGGWPYLVCTGADQQHFEAMTSLAQPGGFLGNNAYSSFFVTESDGTGSYGALIGATDSSDLAKASVRKQNNGSVAFYKYGFAQPLANADALNAFACINPPTAAQGRFGTQAVPIYTFNDYSNYGTGTTAACFLGHPPAGNYYRGRIYEVIHFRREISIADATEVLAYLKSKYNIT